MINFDFECAAGHRFEGSFSDYNSFHKQHEKNMVLCPLCNTHEVKRIYRGCSIQPGSNESTGTGNIFRQMDKLNRFVKENFEDVGTDFAETAKAIHYGVEEERGIYGVAEASELKELIEEGVSIFPIPETGNMEN